MTLQETSIQRRTGMVIGHDKRFYLKVKRLMDFIFSLLLIILLFPLLVLICTCVKLDSRGPIIFKQGRVGQNRRRQDRRGRSQPSVSNQSERRSGKDRREKDLSGKQFCFYKFRTMKADSDPGLHRRFVERLIGNQIATNSDTKDQDSCPFKMEHDHRVTRVGHILRRTSLDELPQVFNVLKGEMSLVGPRPPIPYEVEHYQGWHKERLDVLPGLTGLWQIQGRSRVPFDEMVRMDLYYIEHMSLGLDLKILFLTPWAVISGKGAA